MVYETEEYRTLHICLHLGIASYRRFMHERTSHIAVNDMDWQRSRLVTIVSSVAVVSTICLFLTGIEICWRIKKRGSTEGIGSAPFHMGFVSGFLWLHYGVVKGDVAVVYVNMVSLSLYTLYLIYYCLKTPPNMKRRQLRLTTVEVVCLTLMHLYVRHSNDALEVVLNRLGFVCLAFNIATVAAPLLALGEVIRSRSTENLPLPLCFANFLVTSEWLLYGFLINDFFIKFPNAVAVIMSIAQIIPFLVYPRRKKTSVVRIP
ncbi:Sugar transporter SWEET1 [Toxocara canis]|uniref:Sugar transporter SWEET n=1 Tax=Toxocara canis TaxID=6265 RepID=A0A0B2UUF3_TOXCA|nr:Sugar transporter SWEET1 [Toxocara canis]